MNSDVEVLAYVNSMVGAHLSAALISARDSKAAAFPFALVQGNQRAMGAVIHAYSALDSALNFVGYQLFENESSDVFTPKEQRGVPVQLLVQNWGSNRLSVSDRLRYVASLKGGRLDGRIESLVAELSTLRNWLVHGYIFQTVALVSEERPGVQNVHDMEHLDRRGRPHDWARPFPNAQFSPLPRLNFEDAKISIRIVIEALAAISNATGITFPVADHRRNKYELFAIEPDSHVEGLLARLF